MDIAVIFISVFAVFVPALMLPGPDFIAVVRSAMSHGTRAGLLTTLGVSAGLCFYATLSMAGLSALLIEYQWLTWTVRILGGSYLIYLGFKLLRAKPELVTIDHDVQKKPQNALVFGFLVTLTNPKAIVLFASVFATAVTSQTPGWVMGMMILLVGLTSLTWYTVVSFFMTSQPVMRRFQDSRHWIERVAGVCFIAIGGKVLADARNPIST